MSSPRTRPSHTFHLLALVAAVALAHGLILFAARDFWDGALYSRLTVDRDWAGTFQPFRDAGYPAHGIYHWLVGSLAPSHTGLAHHAVGLTCLVLIGGCLYGTLLAQSQSSTLAFATAAYVVTHPMFGFMVSTGGNVPTLVSAASFAVGASLLLGADSRSLPGRGWEVLAVPCLLIAFAWRSFLFYFLFVVGLKAYRWHLSKGQSPFRALWAQAPMLALPLLYYLANSVVFSQAGYYRSDNTFQGLWVMAKEAVRYFAFCFPTALVGPWAALFSIAGLSVAAILVAMMAWMRHDAEKPMGPKLSRKVWVSAAALAALGGFPYIFVGKVSAVALWPWPHFTDWTARWFLLGVLPLGLALMALILAQAPRLSPRVATFAIACVLAANIVSSQREAMRWVKASIVDDRLVSALRQDGPGPGESWCLVEPGFRSGGLVHRAYELSALLSEAGNCPIREVFPADWDDGQGSTPPAPQRPRFRIVAPGQPLPPDCSQGFVVNVTRLENASLPQLLKAAARERDGSLVDLHPLTERRYTPARNT